MPKLNLNTLIRAKNATGEVEKFKGDGYYWNKPVIASLIELDVRDFNVGIVHGASTFVVAQLGANIVHGGSKLVVADLSANVVTGPVTNHLLVSDMIGAVIHS